jgi:hypothetical protein
VLAVGLAVGVAVAAGVVGAVVGEPGVVVVAAGGGELVAPPRCMTFGTSYASTATSRTAPPMAIFFIRASFIS